MPKNSSRSRWNLLFMGIRPDIRVGWCFLRRKSFWTKIPFDHQFLSKFSWSQNRLCNWYNFKQAQHWLSLLIKLVSLYSVTWFTGTFQLYSHSNEIPLPSSLSHVFAAVLQIKLLFPVYSNWPIGQNFSLLLQYLQTNFLVGRKM